MINLRLAFSSTIPAVICEKLIKAIEEKNQSYCLAKDFNIPVAMRASSIMERILAIDKNWIITAINPYQYVLQTAEEGFFSIVNISQRPKYSTIYIQTFSSDIEVFKSFEAKVRHGVKDCTVKGIIFSIRWAYQGKQGYDTVNLTELYDDILVNEAYPDITAKYGSVDNFIRDFLVSDESVLILQGPAGTGKTRLIRNILANMNRMRTISESSSDYSYKVTDPGEFDECVALYTGDKRVLESEEIYANFVNADENILVIEDADLMLKPRSDGNEIMHHFLMVADGIIRGSGRKVIFSTNLSNKTDIDEALIRPGRCYGVFNIRALTKPESLALLAKVYPGQTIELKKDKYTIAELYNGRF